MMDVNNLLASNGLISLDMVTVVHLSLMWYWAEIDI